MGSWTFAGMREKHLEMGTMSWSVRCICVIMREQGRVGKDVRMDAEIGVIGGRRKALLS